MALALVLLGAALLAQSTPFGQDYGWDAGPAINALARGDLDLFVGAHPQMGQLTVLLRAPAVMLAGEGVQGYQLGALLCLAGIALLAVPLARRSPRHGAAAAFVLAFNPVTLRALELGHPEEPLGAVLCVVAVLLALDGRARAAGVALGLALATKQWALFAVLPVVFALHGRRARGEALAVAGGLAALFTVPVLVADPGAFFEALQRPTSGLSAMRPGNLWNLVAADVRHVDHSTILLVPDWLRAAAHPGIVALALIMGLLLRRRDAFAVLALIFLARCALDPWNHEYYHWPFLAALAAWEVLSVRRAPWLTAASSALLWLVFARLVADHPRGVPDLLYLTWATVVAVTLWRWTPNEHPARSPTPSPRGSSAGRPSSSLPTPHGPTPHGAG